MKMFSMDIDESLLLHLGLFAIAAPIVLANLARDKHTRK